MPKIKSENQYLLPADDRKLSQQVKFDKTVSPNIGTEKLLPESAKMQSGGVDRSFLNLGLLFLIGACM